MSRFPTEVPSYPTWGGNDKMADVDHAGGHDDVGDDIEALARKIGTGASDPAVGKVLTGTGVGTSEWADPADARLQSSTTPSPVGTAAVGTGTTDARADHVHAASGNTPSTQAFGDAAATGTSAKAAQSDHKHAMPTNPVPAHEAAADPHTGYLKESDVSGFATPAVTLGTAAAAGSATTAVRTDATIAAFDATAPSTQAFGDAAAAGTAAVAARRDHKHAMPSERAAASTTPAAVGTAAVGTGTTDARADHVHATGAGTPSTQAFGDAASIGSGPAAAMTDHKHAMPSERAAASTTPAAVGTAAVGVGTTDARADHVHATGAGTPSTQAFGDAAAVGTGPAAAMTDHKHAMPANPVRSQSSTTPAAVGTAAVGTGTTDARADHVHATGAGTPAAVSTANAVGSGPAAAMTDHVHAHEAGHTAHDTIWDAAGDLAVGTGADIAARLALTVPAANILEVLGVVNGETTPTWKAVHDGTAPAAVGTAAAGTALTAAHRDHVHATGAGTPSTQAFGDAAATGSGPAAAMTDHKHAMPALGTGAANAAAGNDSRFAVEGTWTPTLSFGGAAVGLTYAEQTGRYTKIGNWVFFEGRITLSNKGSSTGAALISGLPFATAAGLYSSAVVGYYASMASIVSPVMLINGSASTISPANSGAAAVAGWTNSNFANGTDLIFSGMYLAA